MGKANKGKTAESAKAAMSRLSDYDIVRAECGKAVKSLKNNPQRAQKLIKETCQKHPNVSLGFRCHAYIERRLAEHQHDTSALKKRHMNIALEAAKQATVLSPNSVEHAYSYAMLLQEYIPPREVVENNNEAIAECERGLAIADPKDPADDMIGRLPKELSTAELRISHFRHQLRQVCHRLKKLARLQPVSEHATVGADGDPMPLTRKPCKELGSEQLLSEPRSAEEMEETFEAVEQKVEQKSQTGVKDKGGKEQQGGNEGERDGAGIGTSQNDGTEETLSEVKSVGESASVKEREELQQVSSGESAEPLTPRENSKSSRTQEEVVEPCEGDEDESSIKCKQCDARFMSASDYLAHHNEQHPSLPPDDLIDPVALPAKCNTSRDSAGDCCPTHGFNACPITVESDPTATVERQHDWHLLRMVTNGRFDAARTVLEDEVLHEDRETTEEKGMPKGTNESGEPASSEPPDPHPAAPAGEPGAIDAVGSSMPPAVEIVPKNLAGISKGEAMALICLMRADGSDGREGIEALRQRDFVKEAVEDVTSCILPFGEKEAVQRALGAKGAELVKHLLGYASGTGVTALRGCPVHFRRLTSQQAGEVLRAFCSARVWWLFTWDLLRSPRAHFEVMREWLERPGNDAVGEAVRGMALAALRVRAYALGEQYRAAKARVLVGETSAGPDLRRELARLALVVASVSRAFAYCIYCKMRAVVVRSWVGQKYADALSFVHGSFVDEPTMDIILKDAGWLEAALAETEGPEALVPDSAHRSWHQTNRDILGCLKLGLQTAIEELKFANLVNDIEEGGVADVESGAERRSKGWEGEARWVVNSFLNVPVIMKWVRRKLGETGGVSFYSEKYLERALLDTATLDAQVLRLQLKVALRDKQAAVAGELCTLLASAVEAADGIPRQLTEAAEQAAAELLRAESEPSEKAVKKGRKKKKSEPKDKPERLSAAKATPSSPAVEQSVENASEFVPGQKAVSEGHARLRGDDEGASPVPRPLEEALPTAKAKGGLAQREPERRGTAEVDASAEGTAGESGEARGADTDPLSKYRLWESLEACNAAGKAKLESRSRSTEPSDAAEVAQSGSPEAALRSAELRRRIWKNAGGSFHPADPLSGAAESAQRTQLTSAAGARTLPADKGAQGPAQNSKKFTKGQLDTLKAQILAFRRFKKGEKTLPPDLLKAIAPPPLGSVPSAHADLKLPKMEGRKGGRTGSDVLLESGVVGWVEALRRRDFVRETVEDVVGRISCARGKDCTDPGDEPTRRFLEYLSGSGVADLPGCPVGFFRGGMRGELYEYLRSSCSERAWWQFTLDLLRSPPEHFFQTDIVRWLGMPENDDVGETIRSMAVAALKMREHALRLEYRAVKERLDRPMETTNGCDGREEKSRGALERLAAAIALTQADFARCVYCEAFFFEGRKYVDVLPIAYGRFAGAPVRDNLSLVKRAQTCIDYALVRREGTVAAASEEHREWVERNFDLLEGQKPGIEAALRELNSEQAAAKPEDEPEKRAAKPWGLLTSSLNVPVVLTWVKRKVAAAGIGNGSVKRVETILWDPREWEPTELHLALKSALGDKGAALATDLWIVLDSARDQPDGIPWQIKEAAEAAAAELLSAESAADAKGTKKGKKKRKKGQSADKPGGSTPAAGGVSNGKVDTNEEEESQLAPGASSPPDNGAGSSQVREAGYGKPGVQTTGDSEPSSRSEGGVEKRGEMNRQSRERRPGDSEPGPGSAGGRAPSDRPNFGAGAGRGAAEAADVISSQHKVGADSASLLRKMGAGLLPTPTPTPSVPFSNLIPPGAPPAGTFEGAPGETKPLTPGYRQLDTRGRSNAGTCPESHVAAGERLTGSGGGGISGGQVSRTRTVSSVLATESVTAASGRQHTQQAPPKPYRPVLPVAGLPTASRGVPAGADVSHDDRGSPLLVLPLTAKEQGAPSSGPQRAEGGSPVIQMVRNETAKRQSNQMEKRSGVLPGVMRSAVNPPGTGPTPIPRAKPTPPSPGYGQLQADSSPQHPPVTSEPPRKPRAPYNPLARALPLAPAACTGQSASAKATGVPITPPRSRTPSVDQRAAKSFQPSRLGVEEVTSAEASADVTRDVLRLLVGGESEAIGPGAQRSPEPALASPELPSILAMLLPVESVSKNVAPPNSAVYKLGSDRPITVAEATESSRVANLDWLGTTESGPDTWAKSASNQTMIRQMGSGRAVERKKKNGRTGAEKQDRQGSAVCCICFDSPKNGAIVPCGHCLCYDCGTLIKEKRRECPFCNTRIESVFRLFF